MELNVRMEGGSGEQMAKMASKAPTPAAGGEDD